jgi:hypothetical protein
MKRTADTRISPEHLEEMPSKSLSGGRQVSDRDPFGPVSLLRVRGLRMERAQTVGSASYHL